MFLQTLIRSKVKRQLKVTFIALAKSHRSRTSYLIYCHAFKAQPMHLCGIEKKHNWQKSEFTTFVHHSYASYRYLVNNFQRVINIIVIQNRNSCYLSERKEISQRLEGDRIKISKIKDVMIHSSCISKHPMLLWW